MVSTILYIMEPSLPYQPGNLSAIAELSLELEIGTTISYNAYAVPSELTGVVTF